MKEFENIYILRGSLTEEQVKTEIENIKQYFKNVKISKNKENINGQLGYLGLKRLAYTIRGEKTGYYYITHFEGTDRNATEIEKKLLSNDNVIKFITIRI